MLCRNCKLCFDKGLFRLNVKRPLNQFLPPKLSLLCITEFIYEFCIGPPLRNVNPLSPSLHALTQYMFEFYPTTVNNTNQLYNKSILFMLPSQLAQPSPSTPFKEMK